MGRSLKINWTELKEMGKHTSEYASELEEARSNFQKIIDSLDECWEGKDATTFKKNCSNYLSKFKVHTIYFETLGKYFDNSSEQYSQVVKENAEKIKKFNQRLMDEKNKYTLVHDEISRVGVEYGIN